MKINYVKGCEVEGDERSGFADALKVAAKSDVIVATMGEAKELSGERRPEVISLCQECRKSY